MIKSEATWTKPRPDCPNPERWHASDAQSTEVEVTELVGAFIRALQPDYVVETGTCIGQTAWMIGMALQANGQGRLDTIELDPERAAHAAQQCSELPVTVHQMDTMSFTPAGPIGFAWFDSETELRVPEFERFRPWITPGAIVGFHDTGPHKGSWSDALFAMEGCRAIRLPTPRGVTFLEVVTP